MQNALQPVVTRRPKFVIIRIAWFSPSTTGEQQVGAIADNTAVITAFDRQVSDTTVQPADSFRRGREASS